ncbi:MAG: cobalamin biosynthesis protein P47K, partial [Acidobacteria bacterium]
QSSGLADTTILSASGFPVEEITGGCFCCRFNSLTEAAERLTARVMPEVFLAEPVGSCTDLKATVSYPLRRMYGDDFSVAPFSVLVDPVRALRVLGLEAGRRFSDKVLYVYGKQLEEADVLVINKIDAVATARLAALRAALRERCPRAVLFEVSAKTGAGLEPWFSHILASDDESRANLDIDYDEYADGEARLGWLNCTARLSGRPFDGNDWVARLVETLQRQLRRLDIEIAHLKMTLTPAEHDRDLCVVNAVSTDAPPVSAFRLEDVIDAGDLIINLRAEGDPEVLLREATGALTAQAANAGLAVTVDHIEHFRPGRPVPTHRVVMA